MRAIRRAILSWYDKNRRDLPWRTRQGDPYAQWVAEVMLQQTRVETVIPYYLRFLKRFPTVLHLARASHDAVLKHWEGLGYYRRALHLHEAAKIIAKSNGRKAAAPAGRIHFDRARPPLRHTAPGSLSLRKGEGRVRVGFPTSAKAWRELPGIGEYTAAAIASIALGEPVAAVDGNVARVVARLFGIESNGKLNGRPSGWKRAVAEAAGRLICPTRPGDFNQALMDLGSAVCTPRNPLCGQCPARRHCKAFRSGRCEDIPGVAIKARPKPSRIVAVALVHDGKVLMRQRPRGGLWSGLWELPCRELAQGESVSEALAAVADSAIGKRDRGIKGSKDQGTKKGVRVRHKLTHRDLVFSAYVCPVNVAARKRSLPGCVTEAKVTKGSNVRWVDGRQLASLAVSTAHRKILARLGRQLNPGAAARNRHCME